jgi:predicted Zn-dependent protease
MALALLAVSPAVTVAGGPQRVAAPPVAVAAHPGDPAGAAPLLDILQAELDRNFTVLSRQPSPLYFLSYTVHDTDLVVIGASTGALVTRHANRERTLTVEARVGDYTLDSTHGIRGDWTANLQGMSRTLVPLADRGDAIRPVLWRTTDRQYKRAVERFTKVKANIAAKVAEEDPAPDFSQEEPQVHVAPVAPLAVDLAEWERRVRRLSAPFAADPLIFQADIGLSAETHNRYLVTSEGTRLATGDHSVRLEIQAMTKADDGMQLPLTSTYSASSIAGLPREDQLLADVLRMVDLLGRLRAAPVVDPYSGPAILSGRAAAVFFHEIFGHRIEGHRQKEAEEGQTFAKMVGQAVLPAFLSVVSDPTLDALDGRDLLGHYLYDDEGVRARRVAVVDKGILRTFLLSRSPLAAFPKSNGHGRAYPGLKPVSRQSNLIVESSRTFPDSTLVEMLKQECRRQGKAFGLLFDNIEGGFTYTGRDTPNAFNVLPTVVYRIHVDGRTPELVRGVDLIGTPLSAFSKIVATGVTTETFNGMCGAESGMVPVSASSPALFVSEVEVQKKTKSQETRPILPAPERKGTRGQGTEGTRGQGTEGTRGQGTEGTRVRGTGGITG